MGYLVAAHVTKSEPDLARLEALPGDIAWAVYREHDARAWYVDTFGSGRKHDWPFTSMPPLKDLPVDVPEDLVQLRRVHAALAEARLADGFLRPFLNLNLRLRCECGDIEVTYGEGKVEIQPLRIEDDDFDLSDLTHLHDPENGIVVMERNKDHSTRLHLIASEEVSWFLGSFDGIQKLPTKVASSALGYEKYRGRA